MRPGLVYVVLVISQINHIHWVGNSKPPCGFPLLVASQLGLWGDHGCTGLGVCFPHLNVKLKEIPPMKGRPIAISPGSLMDRRRPNIQQRSSDKKTERAAAWNTGRLGGVFLLWLGDICYIYIYIYIYLYIYIYNLYISIYIYVSLSIYLSIYIYIYLLFTYRHNFMEGNPIFTLSAARAFWRRWCPSSWTYASVGLSAPVGWRRRIAT